MSDNFQQGGGPGRGVFPGRYVVPARNDTGADLTIFQNAALDFAGGTGAPGDVESGYATLIDVAAGAAPAGTLASHVLCIAQEAIANGAVGKVMLYGRTQCASAAAAKGNRLIPVTATNTLGVATGTGEAKIVAIVENVSSPFSTTLPMCWFSGVSGFGSDIL